MLDRFHKLLTEVSESLEAAQKTYKGQKRSELKDSDFLFPETRSFPVVTPQDIPDAISNFGRMKGKMSYEAFLRKLYNMAKRKGPEFVAALPEASKEQLGIKKTAELITDAAVIPVPVMTVTPTIEDPNPRLIKKELVDEKNNDEQAELLKTRIDNLVPSDPNNDVSLPNAEPSLAACGLKAGDMVKNINKECIHYGSEGIVQNIEELPDYMGQVVVYKTTNAGTTWKEGDLLKKTENQLANMQMMQRREPSLTINEVEEPSDLIADDSEEDDEHEYEDPVEMEMEKLEKEIELEMLKQKLAQIKKSKGQDFTKVEDMEEETVLQEMMEYKNDFYEMSLGSLRAIATHSQEILNSLDNPMVKENLTESWLQGKIAITEDYMRTIHDFIMYVSEAADTRSAVKRPGLWENIRKKKEREGKKYRPAKPGDKDRPDPEQWNKLQKLSKKDKN